MCNRVSIDNVLDNIYKTKPAENVDNAEYSREAQPLCESRGSVVPESWRHPAATCHHA